MCFPFFFRWFSFAPRFRLWDPFYSFVFLRGQVFQCCGGGGCEGRAAFPFVSMLIPIRHPRARTALRCWRRDAAAPGERRWETGRGGKMFLSRLFNLVCPLGKCHTERQGLQTSFLLLGVRLYVSPTENKMVLVFFSCQRMRRN